MSEYTSIRRGRLSMMFKEGVVVEHTDGSHTFQQHRRAPEIGEAYSFVGTEPTTRVFFDVSAGCGVQMEVLNSDPDNVLCHVERISEFHGHATVLRTFLDVHGIVECGVSRTPDPSEPYMRYGWRVFTIIDGNESKFIICCNHTGVEYDRVARGDRQGLPAPWSSNQPASAALPHREDGTRQRPTRHAVRPSDRAPHGRAPELPPPRATGGFGDGVVDAAMTASDANRWTMPVTDAWRYRHAYSAADEFSDNVY